MKPAVIGEEITGCPTLSLNVYLVIGRAGYTEEQPPPQHPFKGLRP